jgi:hypothetical protein
VLWRFMSVLLVGGSTSADSCRLLRRRHGQRFPLRPVT